jgi:hypothetical protein
VRRAAFQAWGVADTTEYVYGPLGKSDSEHAGFDDVRAVAIAIARVNSDGLDAWVAPALSHPRVADKAQLKSMVGRGLQELATLQKTHGVK